MLRVVLIRITTHVIYKTVVIFLDYDGSITISNVILRMQNDFSIILMFLYHFCHENKCAFLHFYQVIQYLVFSGMKM